MLAVTSIAGNIFADKHLGEKYRRAKAADKGECLLISRMEMERHRLRRRTDRGTDVGIVLEPGNRLHHGDVLESQKFIVVEQVPEKVLIIGIKKGDAEKMIGTAARVGHTLGNRHRPISLDRDAISFPIQSELEVDTFRELLPSDVELKLKEQVFIPLGEVHSHE